MSEATDMLDLLLADARTVGLATARNALLIAGAVIVVRLLRGSLRAVEARLARERPGTAAAEGRQGSPQRSPPPSNRRRSPSAFR